MLCSSVGDRSFRIWNVPDSTPGIYKLILFSNLERKYHQFYHWECSSEIDRCGVWRFLGCQWLRARLCCKSVRTKGDTRKNEDAITRREVTSALELRAETTSLLVPKHSLVCKTPDSKIGVVGPTSLPEKEVGSQKTWVFISLHRLQIRYSKILLILARSLLIGYFTFY